MAVSSAGNGGHGAFLGTFLDELPARRAGAFDETAAHELAHSWWGYSVTSYGRGTKFLREAFCTFGAWHLGRTAFHTDRFREETAMLMFDGTLARPLFRETEDSESGAYTKGALVLELLRQEMGDETFSATLRAFASRFRNRHVSFADFVAVCNDVSRRDWLPFLTHWCYGRGLPADRVVGELARLPRLLRAPTPEGRQEQLHELLRRLTGADVPLDPSLAGWRDWWRAHRSTFQPGPEARQLSPGGLGGDRP